MTTVISQATLLVIPCSGAKRDGSASTLPTSMLLRLDPELATALRNARVAQRERAMVDERTLMSAHERYSGQVYEHGGSAIRLALSRGVRIVIVSGGYGLLLAEEPTGEYNRRFSLSDWPGGLLEQCLLDYARRERIENVIAVMSTSTAYGSLVRRVRWREARLSVVLLSPVAQGGGSMVKVPRAQGQALDALVSGSLSETWRSSDGLTLRTENIGV
jgi:hypothetical protein